MQRIGGVRLEWKLKIFFGLYFEKNIQFSNTQIAHLLEMQVKMLAHLILIVCWDNQKQADGS